MRAGSTPAYSAPKPCIPANQTTLSDHIRRPAANATSTMQPCSSSTCANGETRATDWTSHLSACNAAHECERRGAAADGGGHDAGAHHVQREAGQHRRDACGGRRQSTLLRIGFPRCGGCSQVCFQDTGVADGQVWCQMNCRSHLRARRRRSCPGARGFHRRCAAASASGRRHMTRS